MKITCQDILDYVEAMRKIPVKQNEENMAKVQRCIEMAHDLARLLGEAKVLPAIADPTFHYSMTVHVVCKKACFEGESLEILREIVRECNVFGIEYCSGELPYRLGFGVSHVWEVLK